MIAGILLGIVAGLLANELCEFSPWCARKLVRWSAFRRYTDSDRAEMRAEELTTVIDDRPGNLFKLITAVSFAVGAVIVSCRRAVARKSGSHMNASTSPVQSGAAAPDLSPEAQWELYEGMRAAYLSARAAQDAAGADQ